MKSTSNSKHNLDFVIKKSMRSRLKWIFFVGLTEESSTGSDFFV